MNSQIPPLTSPQTVRGVPKVTAEDQKKADQGTKVEPSNLSVGNKYSTTVNDQDHPLELKHLGTKEAWVDCPFCHSRVQTRIEKHVKKEDMAWSAFSFLMSFMYINRLSARVHTTTHYCPNCEEAIAARKPDSKFAQTLERSEFKTHGS